MTLFFSFFQTLEGKEVVVELKNDVALRGILQSVDQYLNIKLDNVSVVDAEAYPQLVRCAHPRRRGVCCASARCDAQLPSTLPHSHLFCSLSRNPRPLPAPLPPPPSSLRVVGSSR